MSVSSCRLCTKRFSVFHLASSLTWMLAHFLFLAGTNPPRPGTFPGASSPGPVPDLYGPASQDSGVGNYISAASPQPGSGFGHSIAVSTPLLFSSLLLSSFLFSSPLFFFPLFSSLSSILFPFLYSLPSPLFSSFLFFSSLSSPLLSSSPLISSPISYLLSQTHNPSSTHLNSPPSPAAS